MRLTPAQRTAIRDAVHAAVGMSAKVRLFGSRTDDRLRGGDIDLMVEIDHAVERPALVGARIGAKVQQALGDRRIDVLLAAPNIAEQPIHRVARETGIEL